MIESRCSHSCAKEGNCRFASSRYDCGSGRKSLADLLSQGQSELGRSILTELVRSHRPQAVL